MADKDAAPNRQQITEYSQRWFVPKSTDDDDDEPGNDEGFPSSVDDKLSAVEASVAPPRDPIATYNASSIGAFPRPHSQPVMSSCPDGAFKTAALNLSKMMRRASAEMEKGIIGAEPPLDLKSGHQSGDDRQQQSKPSVKVGHRFSRLVEPRNANSSIKRLGKVGFVEPLIFPNVRTQVMTSVAHSTSRTHARTRTQTSLDCSTRCGTDESVRPLCAFRQRIQCVGRSGVVFRGGGNKSYESLAAD
jgi:hypothetical protein